MIIVPLTTFGFVALHHDIELLSYAAVKALHQKIITIGKPLSQNSSLGKEVLTVDPVNVYIFFPSPATELMINPVFIGQHATQLRFGVLG